MNKPTRSAQAADPVGGRERLRREGSGKKAFWSNTGRTGVRPGNPRCRPSPGKPR